MKYKNWLDEWYNNYILYNLKPKTCERYSQIIKQHLKIKLGEYELEELTPLVLQRFIAELMRTGNLINGNGLASNSVNGIITVIQNSLKTAYIIGMSNEYSADRIKRPKSKEKKLSCFTLQEQKKIEQYILSNNKRKLFGIVFCLYSGLRIGELLALTWADFNFIKKTVTINKTCSNIRNNSGKSGYMINEPKTDSSDRIIPLPEQLFAILIEYKKKSLSDYVIESEKGEPIAVRSYQRSFELLQKKLGIDRKNFHSLRHTFATRALECGMDVKTLSEILGHKNPNITLNRYVHSMSEHKKDMMNRIGKFLHMQ